MVYVVIDPCAGSGSTLLASSETYMNSYGFEIDRKFYEDSKKYILKTFQKELF